MKNKCAFKSPYGYVESTAFISKQSRIEEALKKNDIVDNHQEEKIDNEVNRSTNEDANVNNKINELVEKDNQLQNSINEIPTEIKNWVCEQHYLTEHQDISGKLDANAYNTDKETMQNEINLKANISDIEDMATQTWVNEQNFIKEHQDISGKLDADTYNADKETFALKTDTEKNKESIVTLNTLVGKVANSLKNDINACSDTNSIQFNSLITKISQIEDKLIRNDEDSATKIENTSSDIVEDNVNNNYILTGNTFGNVNINGKNIIVKNMASNVGKKHILTSNNGDINLTQCTYNGNVNREAEGNTEIAISTSGIVNVRDSQFNSNTYNQIEVSLGNECVKGVNIDNCSFGGKKSNNAINLFGFQDSAVVNITNCTFEDVSQALRISNRTNAKNVVINIINCKVKKWENNNLDYAGLILLQDYTSATNEEVIANKQFSTMTINIVNLEGPNGKIKQVSDLSEVCASKNEKQLIYMYCDNADVKLRPYSVEEFPLINIR